MNDNNITVYISGLMSFVKGFNKARFNALADRLRKRGVNVINPAELDVLAPVKTDGRSAEHDATLWWEYIDRDVRFMLSNKPDVLVLMDGWECSDGARIEYITARRINCDILTEHEIMEASGEN